MKDSSDNYACELEMKGGYHGHPYPQKFVRAPLSQHPSPAPSNGKATPAHDKAFSVLGL